MSIFAQNGHSDLPGTNDNSGRFDAVPRADVATCRPGASRKAPALRPLKVRRSDPRYDVVTNAITPQGFILLCSTIFATARDARASQEVRRKATPPAWRAQST